VRGPATGRSVSLTPLPPVAAPDIHRFAIGFDQRDRARLHGLWDEVIDSQQWSQGPMTERFEASWAAWNGLEAVAVSGWSGGALAALAYAGVRGEAVLMPSNTFMATPLAGRPPAARTASGVAMNVLDGIRTASPRTPA